MRISLVIPNVFEDSRILIKEKKEALGILYLTSVLRNKGHIVNIIEAGRNGLSLSQTKDIILLSKPDFVGFSVVQRTYNIALKISKLLRIDNYNNHICFGGYFPTMSPDSLGDNHKLIDSYILGEGEITLLELVEAIDIGKEWNDINGLVWFCDDKIVYNKYRSKIEDIDIIPFPARDLLPYALNDPGFAAIISSRGCYGQCSFCTTPAYDRVNPGKSWRGRSPNNLVDEIELLVNEYGVKRIEYNDDNIFGPGKDGVKRVEDICAEIGKRDINVSMMAYCRVNDVNYKTMKLMKEVGFERILIGVESVNEYTLQKYNKGINCDKIKDAISILEQLEINITSAFIMYDPYTKLDGLKKNLYFLKSLNSYEVDITGGLRVTDNALIQKQLQEEGKLVNRSVNDGHTPYKVGENVAKVYYINKLFVIYYYEIIKSHIYYCIQYRMRNEKSGLKTNYEIFIDSLWHLQADFMDKTIRWVKEKANVETIRNSIEDINDRVIDMLNKTGITTSVKQIKTGIFDFDHGKYVLNLDNSDIHKINDSETIEIIMKLLLGDDILNMYNKYNKAKIDYISNNFEMHVKSVDILPIDKESLDNIADKIHRIVDNKIIDYIKEEYIWTKKNLDDIFV